MGQKITVEQLSADLATEMQWSKRFSKRFISDMFQWIKEQVLDGFTVHLKQFGHFKLTKRKARSVLHPSTQKRIQIGAQLLPLFKPEKSLVQHINQKKGIL